MFIFADCAGTYVLDMAIPSQRATLIAIMRMFAVNTSIAVKSLEMPSDGGKGGLDLYTVTRENVDRSIYSVEDKAELEELLHLSQLTALSHEQIAEAAKVLCIMNYFPKIRNFLWLLSCDHVATALGRCSDDGVIFNLLVVL